MSSYTFRWHQYQQKASVLYDDLPVSLQRLMDAFENALNAMSQADPATRKRLLLILVNSDAVISAELYRLYGDRIDVPQVDKVKLLALKAKALRLKLEQNDNS